VKVASIDVKPPARHIRSADGLGEIS